MQEHIIEAWKINNEMNLLLVDHLDEEAFACVSASKGKTIGEHFSHLHNVRIEWLENFYPEQFKDIEKISRERSCDKAFIKESLVRSGEAVIKLLRQTLREGKIKGYKKHPVIFTGYLISHDSHHRGQILLALKQCGKPVDKEIQYGIWDWDK
jgi:uncharacterized damage-inducible protein DinB